MSNNYSCSSISFNKFYKKVRFSENEVIFMSRVNVLRQFLYINDLSGAILFAFKNWDPSSLNAPTDSNNEPYTFLMRVLEKKYI